MRKLILILLLAFAGSASAQEATLNAPVAHPAEAKYTVKEVVLTAAQVIVSIQVKGSGNEDIRYFNVVDPDTAAFFTALDTVRPTETGGVLRRANFRILGRLLDAGIISGVTLVP